MNDNCTENDFAEPISCPYEWKYLDRNGEWKVDPKLTVQCEDRGTL